MNTQEMRREILNVARANGARNLDSLWLALIFRTESELRQICAELNIPTQNHIGDL